MALGYKDTVPARYDECNSALGEPAKAIGYSPRPLMTTEQTIDFVFTYQPANELQTIKFIEIREAAKHLAKLLYRNVPAGADRTFAIRKVREAVMTANAGISLDGQSIS